VDASISLETTGGNSRFHGTSLQFDVENLEVVTSGGLLRLLPKQIEFEYPDGNVWASLYSPSRVSLIHNEKTLVALNGQGGDSYSLNMSDVKAQFLDILLEEDSGQNIGRQLCVAEVCRKRKTCPSVDERVALLLQHNTVLPFIIFSLPFLSLCLSSCWMPQP
jgi:hypothetical protein